MATSPRTRFERLGRWPLRFAVVLAASALAASPAVAAPVIHFSPTVGPGVGLGPPPPPSSDPLVVDDGSHEGRVGVGNPAEQFLWFNQFDLAGPFVLEEIRVLFPLGEATIGDAIELVVYTDDDGDPTNGATHVASYNQTVQVADGATFSVYPITPLLLDTTGEVLIGVIPRWITSGVTPATEPAALDTTASQMRSWIATWSGDPPSPALLPPDGSIALIDATTAGNWLIRGFGSFASAEPVTAIPTLGQASLVTLVALLGLAGAGLLRRRRTTTDGL